MTFLKQLGQRINKALGSPLDPMAVRGIDVSHHQGVIDWERVADTDNRFAIVKLTEGADHYDSLGVNNAGAAHAAGLVVAPYHFGTWWNADAKRPEVDAMREADFFLSSVKLMEHVHSGKTAWLDIEWDGKGRGKYMTPDLLCRWVGAFTDYVRAAGYKPGIYTGANFWKFRLNNTEQFNDLPLWLASYRRKPKQIPNWPATIWQFTGSGSVPGVKGKCDINQFMGTRLAYAGMFE